MNLKHRLMAALAGLALALATLGGTGVVALATAPPAAAATKYGGDHLLKSPICWAFNICHVTRHCVWRKSVKHDPVPRWHCHDDRH